MDDPIAYRSVEEDLHDDLRAMVKAELRPGERLLWAARAVGPPLDSSEAKIRTASAWLAASVAVTIAGLAFAAGWFGPVPDPVRPLAGFGAFFGAVVAFFSAFGLIVTASSRAKVRRQAATTAYALTAQRAVLWRPRHGRAGVEVYTVRPKSLSSLHRVELPDGSGDVVFGVGKSGLPWGAPQGFLGVAEVRRVEALAREVLLDPNPPSSRDEEFS